jgi:hypothetical protein
MSAPTCGRPTELCGTCHHHRKCHKAQTCVGKGPRNPCTTGATYKATGEPCNTFAPRPCMDKTIMQNGACRRHGGKNPSGFAHYNYQGKGHSTLLPKRMQQDYLDARTNPERLSLEGEIAELRALRAELWRTLDGDMGMAVTAVRAAASDIRKALQQAMVAQKNGNAEKFAEALQAITNGSEALSSALSPVMAFEAARDTAADLAVKTERLLRTENTRIIEERGMVSLEAALADRHTLVQALLGAVTKHVRDSEVQTSIRRSVGAEYARLTGRRDPAPTATTSGPPIVDAEYSTPTD